MLIHISRDGEQFGPYTLEDANAYLAQGSLFPTDQAWYEGAADWMPITEVPGIQWGTAPEVAATGGKSKTLLYAGIAAAVFGVVGWGYFGKEKEPSVSADASPATSQTESPKSTSSASGSASFSKTVEPIFRKYGCYKCHNSKESNKVEADLDFSIRSSLKPFLSPNQKGNPATTPLVLALTATAANGKPMPPKGARVSDAEVETIMKWIVAGWE
ncbi:MAG: DUF4339 domain-containing protein [Verrucomicrobiota bacterium]|nr:DUF4339 domain-containing protein [Verrucomicrobiota bacterium]